MFIATAGSNIARMQLQHRTELRRRYIWKLSNFYLRLFVSVSALTSGWFRKFYKWRRFQKRRLLVPERKATGPRQEKLNVIRKKRSSMRHDDGQTVISQNTGSTYCSPNSSKSIIANV